MKILIVDTHSAVTSVAIMEEEKLLGEYAVNEALNHSDNLVPMIGALLENLHLSIKDMDGFVVTIGPGSFTGIRIGMTTMKTFAQIYEKPIVGINTLEAIAGSVYTEEVMMAIVDGRGGNVYLGEYQWQEGYLRELRAPKFISLDQVLQEDLSGKVFVGSDVNLFQERLNKTIPMSGTILFSAGRLGLERLKKGEVNDGFNLLPEYLRLSQAQRDILAKEKAESEQCCTDKSLE